MVVRWPLLAASSALLLLAVSPVARADSVYVGNYSGANISQYTELAGGALTPMTPPTAATDMFPQGIAVSPDGRSLYVANQGSSTVSGTVSQYSIGDDGALTPKTPATVASGAHPYGIAVSPDGKSVYVTAPPFSGPPAGEIWQYDVGAGGALTAKATSNFATGGTNPTWIAISPDGDSVYVTSGYSNSVSQYDVSPTNGNLTPKSVPTVPTNGGPGGIAVSLNGKSVYVTNQTGGSSGLISQYDVGSGGKLSAKSTATVASAQNPFGIVVSPDGANVYVADYGDLSTAGAVSQYGVGSGGALVPKSPRDVVAGKGPEAIAISRDGTSVYVVNGADGTVSQYDIKAGGLLAPKSTKTVNAGSAPFEIAVSPPPKFTPPGPKSHTVITSGPSGNTYSAPFFTFKSDIPNATFQCRIDNEPFARCVTPYGRYDLKLGPHTFFVRSVDANGKPEAVPASRSFTLRTVTDTGNCLEYIPWDLFVADRYLTARGCVPLKGTCPVGSVCTVTGTVDIREEDKNSSQYGLSEIFAASGEPTVYCYTDAPTPSLPSRITPDVPCPGTVSWTILGGTRDASTNPTEVKCWALGRETSPGEQRGPDDQRLMTCSGRFTIAPVRSRFVSVGGLSIGGGLGGPGTLTVKAGGVHSASVVAARRKARPAFASIKKKILKAGPVVLRLKPNTRARKLLRKGRALKVTLKFVFTPKGGGARKSWKEKLTVKLPGKPCTPRRHSGCPHGS